MITNPSQFFELQRVQVNAFNAVAHALLAATEKLSSLNVSACRSAIDGATDVAQSLSSVKDPNQLMALSGASAQPSVEKFVNYTRELTGIANGVSAEIGKVFQQQVSDSNRRMADLLDYVAKSAPPGSEQALAMLRSAVAAGNTAFDTASKVSRQTADWAQANLATATKATGSAIAATKAAA